MEASSERPGAGRVWLSIRKRGFPERHVFLKSARTAEELNPVHGKILENREDGNTYPYEQHFFDVTGYIDDVKIRKSWIKKKDGTTVPVDNIEIYMESAGTQLVVNISFDSLRGKSFAKKFRNINTDKKVTLEIIDFTNPRGEKIEGLKIYNHYGDEKEQVMAYYDEHNLEQPEEKEQRDGSFKLDYTRTNNDLFRKFTDDIMFSFKHGVEPDKEKPVESHPPANNAYNRDPRRDDRREETRRAETQRDEPRRNESRDSRTSDRRDEPRQEDRRTDTRRDEPRRDERREDSRYDDRRSEEPRRDEQNHNVTGRDSSRREERTRTTTSTPSTPSRDTYNPSVNVDRNDSPYDDVPF